MPSDTLLVDLAATARLTRLVTRDHLTRRVRRAAIHTAYRRAGVDMVPDWDLAGPHAVIDDPEAPDLAYLLSCDWCSSMWVGLAVIAARRWAPAVWDPIARALAASYVSGVVASRV